MQYFADIIEEKKCFEYAEKCMICIKDMCRNENLSEKFATAVLDSKWCGMKLAYETYKTHKDLMMIPSRQGTLVIKRNKCEHIAVSPENIEEANTYVSAMRISVTGAYPGSIIKGVASVATGSGFKLVRGFIPPSKDDLDVIRKHLPAYETYLNKLNAIPFFRGTSRLEKSVWLSENERSGEFDMSQIDVDIFVTKVDERLRQKMQEESVDVITTESMHISKVMSMFPGKPGSRASRKTLAFFPRYWELDNTMETVKGYSGIVYDMNIAKFMKGTDKIAYVFEKVGDVDIAVVLQGEKGDYVKSLMKKFSVSKDEYESITKSINFFTPSVLKSLLQKIIRYAPYEISVPDSKVYDSELFCCVVFTVLLLHSGSFVPDIQRFVSGKESAMKRLAVSILEDSWIESSTNLLKVMVMAFLCQRLDGWLPTVDEYEMCLDMCIESIRSRDMYVYESHSDSWPDTQVAVKNSELYNVFALLKYVKSFATDLSMTHHIAENKGAKRKLDVHKRPKIMRIERCLDHHCVPEIAYFMDERYIIKSKTISKPFEKLFSKIWTDVSGQNSRKSECVDSEFAKDVHIAQRLIYKSLRGDTIQHTLIDKFYEKEYVMNIGWLAGLVGVMYPRMKPQTMVTLRPDSPYEFVALKRPARGMKDGSLSDREIESAIFYAKEFLTRGIVLDACMAPVPHINNWEIRLNKGVYEFGIGRETKSWEQFSKINLKYKLCEKIRGDTFENIIFYKGDGIYDPKYKLFDEKLRMYDQKVAGRLMSYLSVTNPTINIAKVSKDGGGTDVSVIAKDSSVWKLMMWLCFYFPSAISRSEKSLCVFEVKSWPVIWDVKSVIKEYLSVSEQSDYPLNKHKFKDISGRKPKQYQLDALQEMIDEYNQKKKGHFLWLTVGLGKTMIVLLYLKYLASLKKLPKYVIYTLPRSAIASIIKEIEHFQLPINIIVPTKGKAKYSFESKELQSDAINLIEHDHMRLAEDMLIQVASKSIFIIDEVHKALNESKRTSLALDIARLSIEFIALTGTPMVDANTYKLGWWLGQLVEFSINDKNFWVAANAMISKKYTTGIDVERKEVYARLTTKENEEYLSLVPKGLGGSNPKASAGSILTSFEVCYEACYREMVEQCLIFLKKGIRVMMVAKNKEAQKRLGLMLNDKGVKDVLILETSIFLSDESVENGAQDYQVVIVPLSKSEGYTLTRMRALITSVYPSNEATRQQLEGRINRVNQRADKLYYCVVHCGILTYVLENHKNAASISTVLSALAVEVDV
ncbi:MAG TPA: SNF2-related protein [Nitrosarchaeum sp.]|nr:SNF2-related protein [Nitrosarchaeum sp.]